MTSRVTYHFPLNNDYSLLRNHIKSLFFSSDDADLPVEFVDGYIQVGANRFEGCSEIIALSNESYQ